MTRQDEFRRRHPDWRHRDVPFGEREERRLGAAWRTVLDSQNGRDVDDVQQNGMTIFLQGAGLRPPGRLLVLGCGTGEEILEAEALGFRAEGLTLGPMNVACAEEMGIKGVRFEDFHASTYETGSFDFVVGRQVWEHSWAPFLFAIECARVLRPGGRIALETPRSSEFTYDSATIHHVFCPTPFQGARLLEKAGFVDVRALDGSAGPPKPFAAGDEHRGDVGGANITFVGTRWSPGDEKHVNQLVRRMTNAAVAPAASATAPTPQTREQAIATIYREVLGREPDEGGLRHYAVSGLSLDEIRRSVTSSEEAQRRQRRS